MMWDNMSFGQNVTEQHISLHFIDYRGHHRKGVEIYNAALVNLQQKPWFH